MNPEPSYSLFRSVLAYPRLRDVTKRLVQAYLRGVPGDELRERSRYLGRRLGQYPVDSAACSLIYHLVNYHKSGIGEPSIRAAERLRFRLANDWKTR